jgi:hypothetical protein
MFQTKDLTSGRLTYSGISRAIVIDINDPLKRGRIRVNSTVLGETGWIPYLTSPGSFSVPSKNDVVYIECDGGYYEHPIAWGNLNRGDDGDLQFPEEFQRVAPTNRGLYTPKGSLIELDDGSTLADTDSGIRLTGHNGTKFAVNAFDDSITAEVVFGDTFELSAANGFQVATPAAGGTSLSMKGGSVDITGATGVNISSGALGDVTVTSGGALEITSGAAADLTITGGGNAALVLSGGTVALGGPAGELLDLVDQIIDVVDETLTNITAITVPTAVGPSGPPTNSAAFIATQATLTTIKTTLGLIKGSL